MIKTWNCEYLKHVIINFLGVRYIETGNWYHTVDIKYILWYINAVMRSVNCSVFGKSLCT
jgi:hypothetical protein